MHALRVSRRNERGSTAVIVAIVIVLAIIIFVAVQLFPLYWDHWNFEEALTATLKLELVPPYEEVENTIRTNIINLLNDMGAQYEEDHIIVTVTPKNMRIRAEVWYSRPHHLPLYPNPKQFYIKVEHTAIVSGIKDKLKLPTPKEGLP